MSKLNNWFIDLSLLSMNGCVCDIKETSEYSTGEIVDYSAGNITDSDSYFCSAVSSGAKYFTEYGLSSGASDYEIEKFTTIYESSKGIRINSIIIDPE